MMKESNMQPNDRPLDGAPGIDQIYTALAEATGRVGEAKAPLFLATLALALLIKDPRNADAMMAIAQAERLSTR
jgi:hypothetical protein